jgi:hypothetical protein
LPTDFQETAESWSQAEIEKAILKSEAEAAGIQKSMEDDEKLNALKEDVKDLQGGYTDVLKRERAKIDYCLHVLEGRGNI